MLKIKSVCFTGLLSLLALSYSAYGAESSRVEIKVATTASCSLSLPPVVDIGDIPFTAFVGKGAGEELTGYDTNLNIATTCYGTDKFRLEFITSVVHYNCLTADTRSGGMGFCLYHGDNKIMLDSAATRIVDTEGTMTTIRVVPLRTGTPTPATHSGTLSVTIAPL